MLTKTGHPPPAVPRPDVLHGQDPVSELFFLAARVHSSPEIDARIVDTAHAISDWQRLVALGEINRVQPLVYRSIQRCRVSTMPERLLRALKGQVAITTLRNESALGELTALQRRFDAQGLRTLHYKGPTVALRFYGELGLRTFHDLDFLVDPDGITTVCDLLERAGYTSTDALTPDERFRHESEQKEYLFQKRGFNVEPHWKFTPRRYAFDIDYSGIWQRAQTLTVGADRLLVPATEDTLVLMMLVGAAGFWKRLQMVADIAAVTHGDRAVDWEAVAAEMKRLRAMRVLHLAVYLASTLSGAAVAPALLDAAREDPVVLAMAREITRNLSSPELCRANTDVLPWKFQPLLWNMREHWRDRLTYLFRTTTTPTPVHTRRMPLPKLLASVYVILVPLHDYLFVPLGRRLRHTLAGK